MNQHVKDVRQVYANLNALENTPLTGSKCLTPFYNTEKSSRNKINNHNEPNSQLSVSTSVV